MAYNAYTSSTNKTTCYTRSMRDSPAPGPEIKAWKTLSSEVVLNEKWFKVRKDTIRLPSGKIIDDYFVWESPSMATVVPFTQDGKFVICQQYRHAVGKIMYQFPSGVVGKDESPQHAAVREMAEEIGYTSDSLTHLGDVTLYATKLTGWQHMFLAQNAVPMAIRQHDAEEPTKVVLVTPAELQQMIDANKFQLPGSLSAALLAMKKLGL